MKVPFASFLVVTDYSSKYMRANMPPALIPICYTGNIWGPQRSHNSTARNSPMQKLCTVSIHGPILPSLILLCRHAVVEGGWLY